ncbi:MAG: type II secretion system protein GspH [Hydrogenophilales bacterium CG03_land_8_20_14_0_80_62_28]|nr:prepilin-type N-terminal cleavage/methylation domain-containing protein [Betaproteobacteria bacterium]OIO77733.1 MAG: type II secretion system protein GspH [Hydrogenophilaceae bacterium CG1_02_62_390]PIV24713.1 MAG: type II secretion system protein GspH [Hydrogenophilales bacterium CG03_land_8_20_14_0_80_62_28]PIW38513.1 MAG: type II secretion system protein GspH [Hydrogenophilales bacterium CG15_BIG_FIL_POST_REV_8_21_14_020_62_31]PIW71264.1 MAG: type II secretion system protein GspH [Hydrog
MTQVRGFTLIEVMVVLVIVAIMAGLVAGNLRPDPGRAVAAEAWRLARLAERLDREANLSGQVLALRWQPDGYRFLKRGDDGVWSDLASDSVYSPRRFDPPMHLTDSGEAVFVPDEEVAPQHWRLIGDGAEVAVQLSALGDAEVSLVGQGAL